MGYEFDTLRLLAEIVRLLAAHPEETGVLAVLAILAGVLWKALRFVLSSAADAILSYFLTERVLKRLSPPDERPGRREEAEELSRELGRLEAAEEARRDELARERRRAGRLEAELREARRPWWRRFLG